MPSAAFYANFDQFDREVERAKQTLGSFEIPIRNVQGSLRRLEQAYDGSRLIGEAIKTAAAIEKIAEKGGLTETELRKLNARFDEAADKARRVGQEMPASFSRVADSVRAQLAPLDQAQSKTTAWGGALTSVKGIATGFVAGFTLDRVLTGIGSAIASTIEWGGKMTDLSAKVGVSTDALQRWEFAATRSGNTLDDLVNASSELSRRLGEGQASTVAALDRLGISFSSIRTLSPEEQFDTVAQALAGVTDQAEFAAVGADLLGRQFKTIAPTIRADLKAVGDEAERLGAVVNGDTLDGLDKLGDVWGDVTLAGRSLIADVLSPMIRAVSDLNAEFDELATKRLPDGRRAVSGAMLLDPAGAGPGAINYQSSAWGLTITDPTKAPQQNLGWVEAGFSYQEHLQREAEAHRDAERRTREMIRVQEAYMAALAEYTERIAVQDRFMAQSGQRAYSIGGPNIQPGQLISQDLTNPWGGVGMLAPAGGSSNFSHLAPRPGWGPDWRSIGSGLPGVVTGAIQGGGNIAGSIGSFLGGSMLSGVGEKLGTSLTKSLGGGMLGNMLGGLVGSAIPLVGSLLGGLLGKLFGPSRGAILGKEADARMDQTRASLLQQYGSLDAIRATGAQGAALADAWNSKNVQGEAWFNERVKAFEEQNRLLGEQRDIQSQIAGIEAERQQWADSLVTTWDQVVGYAEKYGIHIEGMGPKIVQLGQTATWTDMLNAIQALERAGGDVGGILVGMTDEMSTLVQQSRRAGTEIPSNLRPYIQSVADAGKLLDENGEAITDLSGIKWGDPVKSQADIAKAAMEKLDEAMQNLVDRLDQIIDRLTHGLPDAASTPMPTVRIPYEYVDAGGGPRTDGEPGYASGGLITRPHRAWVGEGGEPELIGPVAFMREALAGALRQVGGGGARVVQVVLDRRVLAEALVDEIPGALRRAGAF